MINSWVTKNTEKKFVSKTVKRIRKMCNQRENYHLTNILTQSLA